MDKACKTKGEKQRCTDKKGRCRKDLTCEEIRIRGLRAKACQKARNTMNRTCYAGGTVVGSPGTPCAPSGIGVTL